MLGNEGRDPCANVELGLNVTAPAAEISAHTTTRQIRSMWKREGLYRKYLIDNSIGRWTGLSSLTVQWLEYESALVCA